MGRHIGIVAAVAESAALRRPRDLSRNLSAAQGPFQVLVLILETTNAAAKFINLLLLLLYLRSQLLNRLLQQAHIAGTAGACGWVRRPPAWAVGRAAAAGRLGSP